MSDPIEGEVVNQTPMKRLTTHDENVVLVLETAFHNGFNITEACQQAGITRTTYYEWLGDDEIFASRMAEARTALTRKAKTNVFKAINTGDPNISLRYLTLRDPDFKPKAEVDNRFDLDTTRKKIKDFLDDDSPDDVSEQPSTADGTEARGEVAEAPTDLS